MALLLRPRLLLAPLLVAAQPDMSLFRPCFDFPGAFPLGTEFGIAECDDVIPSAADNTGSHSLVCETSIPVFISTLQLFNYTWTPPLAAWTLVADACPETCAAVGVFSSLCTPPAPPSPPLPPAPPYLPPSPSLPPLTPGGFTLAVDVESLERLAGFTAEPSQDLRLLLLSGPPLPIKLAPPR